MVHSTPTASQNSAIPQRHRTSIRLALHIALLGGLLLMAVDIDLVDGGRFQANNYLFRRGVPAPQNNPGGPLNSGTGGQSPGNQNGSMKASETVYVSGASFNRNKPGLPG